MAAPGRKPTPKTEKAKRGTLQPSRDGVSTLKQAQAVDDLKAAAVTALSLKPPELPDDVAEVWADYADEAIANGARQCDADSFAEWCTMSAKLREVRKLGAAAPASYVAQWRMLGELFGLAGPGSRIHRGPKPEDKPANPFARNGRR